jgi:hypothetical protein
MRLPNAAFTINEPALHTNSGLTGTIAGIRRHPQEDTLQYLFDCVAFKQWLTVGKLDKVKDEEGVIEYKQFNVSFTVMRETQTVVITVQLPGSLSYGRSFPLAKQESAKGLYGYLTTLDTVTESLLTAVDLEKV